MSGEEYRIDERAAGLIEFVERVNNEGYGARYERPATRVVSAVEVRHVPDDGKRHWVLTLRQMHPAPQYGWTEWNENWSDLP